MITEAIIFLNTYQLTGIMGFPCGLADKESTCNVRDLDLIPGLGKSPGEGKGYPLQSSHFIFHPYINLVKLTRLTLWPFSRRIMRGHRDSKQHSQDLNVGLPNSQTHVSTPFVPLCQVASAVSDSFVISWTVAHQAPLSMGFSMQEYWSGLLCFSPGECSQPRD